ncbi:tripartite motif-containing protein 5-like [Lytechinus variegatus]|uniref:tripartite motif-containing protein 5-like n=1 Tax=Lytechinus variegatus TaxID=7654 RepID=UPI001BB2BFB1|nr:tripartite motif-containing protein 5-like [Lytechinus variegatus]
MASSLRQSIGMNLECPVCLGFLKDHRILPCSHTFCRGCLVFLLNSQQDKQNISCPVCRETTPIPDGDVGGLPMSKAIQSMVAVVTAESEKEINFNESQRADVTLKRPCTCDEHMDGDEECFCANCGKYICYKCGIGEHVQEGHTVMEAERHKDTVKSNVDELLAKAATKICDIEKYIACIAEQWETCEKVEKELHDDINQAFEKSVAELMERKELLKSKVENELKKMKTSLLEMEKITNKQVTDINKASELVRGGLKGFLQKASPLNAHETLCEELEKLLKESEPDQEGLRRLTHQSESIRFESDNRTARNLLGCVRRGKQIWRLVAEKQLPLANSMNTLAVSPNNTISVGCHMGGIVTYSADGIIQGIVLKNVIVRCLQYRSDCCYIVRNIKNKISLYTPKCKKLVLSFFSLDDEEGGSGGLSQDRDGHIFIGYRKLKEIHMYNAEGGIPVRKIKCDGYEPRQIFSLLTSNRILVKDSNTIKVINSISGTILHSVTKEDLSGFPCLCTDDTVLIAWVNHEEGVAKIYLYTSELKTMKTIISDFHFQIPERNWYFLQTFKSGEIAFCTPDRLYIFRESQE